MTQVTAVVPGKPSLVAISGISALGLSVIASLGVLIALNTIFLAHHPALYVTPSTMYVLLGAALMALLLSGVTLLITLRVLRRRPANASPAAPDAAQADSGKTASPPLTAQQQAFRAASVVVALVSFVTTVLVVVAPFRAPCASPFSDTFHGTYDPCWSWEHPNGGSITAQSDGLRMVGAPGGDFYYQNLKAPRLLQPLNATAFTIETSLTYTTVQYGDYQGAGLLVWQDTKNYVRLEFGNFGSQNSQGVGFGIMHNGAYQRIIDAGAAFDPSPTVGLRLERDGDTYSAWWRDNDTGPWFTLGTGKVHLVSPQAGIIVAVGANAQKPPIAVFHHFTVILPKV